LICDLKTVREIRFGILAVREIWFGFLGAKTGPRRAFKPHCTGICGPRRQSCLSRQPLSRTAWGNREGYAIKALPRAVPLKAMDRAGPGLAPCRPSPQIKTWPRTVALKTDPEGPLSRTHCTGIRGPRRQSCLSRQPLSRTARGNREGYAIKALPRAVPLKAVDRAGPRAGPGLAPCRPSPQTPLPLLTLYVNPREAFAKD